MGVHVTSRTSELDSLKMRVNPLAAKLLVQAAAGGVFRLEIGGTSAEHVTSGMDERPEAGATDLGQIAVS